MTKPRKPHGHRILIVALSAWVWPTLAPAADEETILSPRLAALQQELKAGTDEGLAAFWRQMERAGAPLIEPIPGTAHQMLVTFLWEAANPLDDVNVAVIGPFNEDDPPATRHLTRLAGSNVWYRTYSLDSAARFSYRLAWPAGRAPHPDAIRRQTQDGVAYEFFADPKCRKSTVGVFFDENAFYSYAEGPDAPPEPWLAVRKAIRKGRTVRQQFRSTILANTREVDVYLPPGYPGDGNNYPFLLLFDGNSYLRTAETPTLLDNLIADGAIPPIVAILVGRIDRGHRNRELPPNSDFARFVVEELVPAMRRDYRISLSPEKAVIGGASYGGLAATAIAQRHPEVFGNVLSQSGSYWWHPGFTSKQDDAFRQQMGWLPRTFATGASLPLRFYMEVGLWEGSSMVLPNRFFRDVLQARGYDVEYHEFVGGHDYVNWRGSLPRGLIYLLSSRKPVSDSGRSLDRQV